MIIKMLFVWTKKNAQAAHYAAMYARKKQSRCADEKLLKRKEQSYLLTDSGVPFSPI